MTQSYQPTSQSAAPAARPARLARIGFRRYSTAEFLAALVLFFLSLPFLEKLPFGDVVESLLLTVALTLAVLAVGGSRKTLLRAGVLVMPVVLGKWLSHYRPDLVPPEVFPVAGMVFVAFVVAQFLRFILRASKVDAEVLCAGISTYLLLGLFWMLAYMLVAQLDADAFAFSTGPASSHLMNRFTAYYFSFVTLSTVGYGDIAPVSNGARALAVAEAMTGTLFVAVLIARLVSLYSTQSLNTDASGQTETIPNDPTPK
jgi:Ion channel